MVVRDEGVVQAAGGVLWRTGGSGVEVAVVHRPRYDDWSFPKGKLDLGETHEQAAVREVTEETGLEVEVGEELSPARYRDARDRPKLVRYWAMQVTGGSFQANDEVDEVLWLAADDAARLLTYPHDVEVLRSLAAGCGDDADSIGRRIR